jgi:hypothetical protein
MEYVRVIFPEKRIVLIDGEEGGSTGRTLRVSEGTHTFKLDGLKNYKPNWRRPTVTGTNPNEPMEVVFEKL